MDPFCKDRDLLAIEPIVFVSSSYAGGHLIDGTGTFSSTGFTSQGANFQAAGVAPGMVITAYTQTPSEGAAYEVVSVDSPTHLTVSVLRPEASAPATPPPARTASFFIRSFLPQIQSVSSTLAEKLRRVAEAAGINAADFADSAQLGQVTAMGALSGVFLARATTATSDDINWLKSEHYRQEFARLVLGLRLAVDLDGDGVAEQTRTLGNVTMRRL